VEAAAAAVAVAAMEDGVAAIAPPLSPPVEAEVEVATVDGVQAEVAAPAVSLAALVAAVEVMVPSAASQPPLPPPAHHTPEPHPQDPQELSASPTRQPPT
jgi:hypothetical protein